MEHIGLEPVLESYVRDKVESGRFSNASQVIEAALRMMMMQDRHDEAKLAWLREAVQVGLESPIEDWEDDDEGFVLTLKKLAAARQ